MLADFAELLYQLQPVPVALRLEDVRCFNCLDDAGFGDGECGECADRQIAQRRVVV